MRRHATVAGLIAFALVAALWIGAPRPARATCVAVGGSSSPCCDTGDCLAAQRGDPWSWAVGAATVAVIFVALAGARFVLGRGSSDAPARR